VPMRNVTQSFVISAKYLWLLNQGGQDWGYVARMGETKNAHRIFLKSLRVRSHSEEVHIDARIILKLI